MSSEEETLPPIEEENLAHQLHKYANYCQQLYQRYQLPLSVGLVALVLSGKAGSWILWPLYQLLLRAVGLALGIGLGLGVATHVYDHLHEQPHNDTRAMERPKYSASWMPSESTSTLFHLDAHASVLASAGYNQPLTPLRNLFPDDDKVSPHLATLTHYISRDFVQSWYHTSINNDNDNSPFLQHVHLALAELWTHLGTRVSHANVAQVVLLDWTKVWAQHVQQWRKKSQTTPKYHRAVVSDDKHELDYLRVLSYRMVKLLLLTHSKNALLVSLVTDILAACVLQPLMGLFQPDVVNGWIVAGLASESSESSESEATSTTTTKTSRSLDWALELQVALQELQVHVDVEECKQARIQQVETSVDWDQARDVVLRLVLVVEAALMDGRCSYRSEDENNDDESDESVTLSQILMDMTGDLDAFEARVAKENMAILSEDRPYELYRPTSTEQSTLRTLIAAWLHTGQIFRAVSVLVQAHTTVLSQFYHPQAFLRTQAMEFCRQLQILDEVDILVDTMAVLTSPRLEEASEEELKQILKVPPPPPRRRSSRSVPATPSPQKASSQSMFGTPSGASQLEFHRNEGFASSLRSERERRLQSWLSLFSNEGDDASLIVSRSNGAQHRELHHLAKIFYTGTNLISIRDASRRKGSRDSEAGSQSEASVSEETHVALLTVETASPRRRIEVPDDDSSFLLRAQPRPLSAIGVHRDQRNHDLSFKSFAATFEEPVARSGSDHYNGARYVRHCVVRYFPSDRTATVALQTDIRTLDQRRIKNPIPETISVGQSSRSAPFLSDEFLRDRHLCQRWVPKGTSRSQSILASNIMEPADFTSTPRTGKAVDFVFRVGFYERPMVDLNGKHFKVHDASSVGTHRADASALELSDPSLSYSLSLLGELEESGSAVRQSVEMGKDGYPILWMKFSRKQDDSQVEVKSIRLSFVRAALLVTASRQEAQLQSLVSCVKAGSAKMATKAITDSRLRPCLRLLEYAGDKSRDKESLLLRDLKLGVNHIDREQLRRNGLLSPRYPTILQSLTAVIEDSTSSDDSQSTDLFGNSVVLHKIRCSAVVEIDFDNGDSFDDSAYLSDDGKAVKTMREEWVIHRSYKDFQTVHKHLKNQVALTESSGTAGSRLVGAASAAFASGTYGPGRSRHRDVLIPSLSQATKVGALGMTKKALLKRQEILNEYLQYLLAPTNMLSRCPELLSFVGAFYPLSPALRSGRPVLDADPLGRTEMRRTIMEVREVVPDTPLVVNGPVPDEIPIPTGPLSNRATSQSSVLTAGSENGVDNGGGNEVNGIEMIPSIRNKIDRIRLPQVRNRLFELLKHQFGFENASFARNRMLAALKTASFAVTTASEFRRRLYIFHTESLNGEAVARLVKLGLDIVWPDGVFFKSAPPLTEAQLAEQRDKCRALLHEKFPDALRAILGQELASDGVNVLHEMLQDRQAVKSLAYTLFDHFWLEVFPELGDVLDCGTALGTDGDTGR